MDRPKTYRVEPHVDPGDPAPTATVFVASGDFDALAQAYRLLGTDKPFDLYQEARLVVQHRPRAGPVSRKKPQ